MRRKNCAERECKEPARYRLLHSPGVWTELCGDCLHFTVKEKPDRVFKIWDLAPEGGGAKDVTATLMIEIYDSETWARSALRIARQMKQYQRQRIGRPEILTPHARIAFDALQDGLTENHALELVRGAIERDAVAV